MFFQRGDNFCHVHPFWGLLVSFSSDSAYIWSTLWSASKEFTHYNLQTFSHNFVQPGISKAISGSSILNTGFLIHGSLLHSSHGIILLSLCQLKWPVFWHPYCPILSCASCYVPSVPSWTRVLEILAILYQLSPHPKNSKSSETFVVIHDCSYFLLILSMSMSHHWWGALMWNIVWAWWCRSMVRFLLRLFLY